MLGLLVPGVKMGGGIGTSWTTAATFLFTEANWLITSFKLRAHLRATSGTVFARVFDETTSAQKGIVSTSSGTINFQTSIAMTLTNGDTYRVEFGSSDGSSCKWKSFDVIQGA